MVNKLSFNVDKTKHMIFQNHQIVIENEDITDLQINDKKIETGLMFQFSVLNHKRMYELEFTFRNDCQQNISYTGYNK